MTEDTFSSNNCANTVLASLFFANKNNANNILGPSCWKEDHNNFVQFSGRSSPSDWGGGGGHPGPEMKGGWGGSLKKPFFGLEIRGPFPGPSTVVNSIDTDCA